MDEQYGFNDERQIPPNEIDTHDEAITTARGMRGTLFRDSLPALKRYDGLKMLAYGEDEAEEETVVQLAEQVDARLRWYEGGHSAES